MTDTKFNKGIQNAVKICMNVTEPDRVMIMSDLETWVIGEALETEVKLTGADVLLVKLEDYGSRPMTEVPSKLIADLSEFKPTVTYYAAESQPGEVKMRMGMQDHGDGAPEGGHFLKNALRISTWVNHNGLFGLGIS